MIMRWFVALLLLTGVAFAQSQEPSLNQWPAGQTEKNSPAKSDTPNQISKPEQSPAVTTQVPAVTLAVEKATNSDSATQKPEKNWWEKVWTDPNAGFAGAVAFFTLALVIVGSIQSH